MAERNAKKLFSEVFGELTRTGTALRR